jgi:hypothetical protein
MAKEFGRKLFQSEDAVAGYMRFTHAWFIEGIKARQIAVEDLSNVGASSVQGELRLLSPNFPQRSHFLTGSTQPQFPSLILRLTTATAIPVSYFGILSQATGLVKSFPYRTSDLISFRTIPM